MKPRLPDDGDRYHGAGCGAFIAALVAAIALLIAVLSPLA